jgi:hypothetical protein
VHEDPKVYAGAQEVEARGDALVDNWAQLGLRDWCDLVGSEKCGERERYYTTADGDSAVCIKSVLTRAPSRPCATLCAQSKATASGKLAGVGSLLRDYQELDQVLHAARSLLREGCSVADSTLLLDFVDRAEQAHLDMGLAVASLNALGYDWKSWAKFPHAFQRLGLAETCKARTESMRQAHNADGDMVHLESALRAMDKMERKGLEDLEAFSIENKLKVDRKL